MVAGENDQHVSLEMANNDDHDIPKGKTCGQGITLYIEFEEIKNG